MLHDNIHIIPRPRGTGGEHGDYAIVARGFPELIVDSVRRREVFEKTFNEADQNYEHVKSAWDQSQLDDDFQSWAAIQRYDRWKNQVITYGGLFDKASIPLISNVSGYDQRDVERIHKESARTKNVRRWIKCIESETEAQIANASWVIGGFMRGFFYNNLAAAEKLQLLTHPFRSAVQRPLSIVEQHDVTNAEEALVKILIGNALTERTKARRVQTWTSTVRKARDFIKDEKLELGATTQAEAEDKAIRVAQNLDLQGGPKYLRRAIDLTLALVPKLAGFTLAAWAIPLTIFVYREITDKTPGEEIGDALLKSDYQFRWLARSVPGRIERTLKPSL